MYNLKNYLQKAKEFSYLSRIDIINTVYKAKGGHLGGSLSVIDILSSIYSLNDDYKFELILSKGHCLLAWLVTLIRVGEINKEILDNFYCDGSSFGGHPKKDSTKSITWSTGSLGHGLSVACGKALAKRNKKFICILGDGEMNEGSVWEALMFSAQHKLNNLLIIVDNNKQESLALTNEILSIENLNYKLNNMNLNAIRIDGHSAENVLPLIYSFLNKDYDSNKPRVIIADTIKGKGVSFMEGITMWHHRKLKDHEYLTAIKEVSKK